MGPITIGLGLACALVGIMTLAGLRTRRDLDDTGFAVALFWVWTLCSAAQVIRREFLPGTDFDLYVGPMSNLAMGAFAAWRWRRRPAGWKLAVFLIEAFQLCGAVAYGLSDKGDLIRYSYKAALNISFLAELLCTASPGVAHVLRHVRGSLPRGPGRGGVRYRGPGA